jgi:hypothetical protein
MQGIVFINFRIVSSIYKENKKIKDSIKNSYNKPTDPILHRFEPSPHNKFKRNVKSLSQENIKNINTSDLMKTSYSVFFEHDRDKRNINLSSQMTKNKKSKKRIFLDKKNESNIKSSSFILDGQFPSRSKKKIVPKKSTHILSDKLPNSYEDQKLKIDAGIHTSKKHFVNIIII